MLMSPADEAWVKELYEANALKLYKVAFRRLGDKDEAKKRFNAFIEYAI